jgi:hypothetical protein
MASINGRRAASTVGIPSVVSCAVREGRSLALNQVPGVVKGDTVGGDEDGTATRCVDARLGTSADVAQCPAIVGSELAQEFLNKMAQFFQVGIQIGVVAQEPVSGPIGKAELAIDVAGSRPKLLVAIDVDHCERSQSASRWLSLATTWENSR